MKNALAIVTMVMMLALPAQKASAQLMTCWAPYFQMYINGIPRCVRWWSPGWACDAWSETHVWLSNGGRVCVAN